MSNIVTYEQAVKLNALGFTERSEHAYCLHQKSGSHRLVSPSGRLNYNQNNNRDNTQKVAIYYSAPTVSETLDYIREEKHIPCYVDAGYCHQYDTVGYWGVILSDFGYIKRVQTDVSPTHPLAASALLTVVLEYLEKKGWEE